MITVINYSKILIYHANVNASLTVANVTQIKIRIMINVGVSGKIQKSKMCAKKIIFAILLHVVAKKANIQQVLLTIP